MSDRPFTRSRTGRLGDTRKKLSSKAKPQARGTHPLLPRLVLPGGTAELRIEPVLDEYEAAALALLE